MGQKSRVTLGASMWIKPHCIFLDEPTNYIDQETLDSLARALKFFRGAVAVISHKQSFLDTVCNETWLVEHKAIAGGGAAASSKTTNASAQPKAKGAAAKKKR